MKNTENFPFSAIVGQDDLKLALVLNAVDPSLGGLLIRGERGTAKSTAARALAELMPAQADGRPAPFVELPLGATEDRVAGSLDLEKALNGGQARVKPGLLHQADGGVLYVDEVNLLPDPLVDLLLDAAASGRLVLERDGVSARSNARFILLGSMNPEEGELRPQFLDRFGLCVEVKGVSDLAQRTESLRRRLSFEADPVAFCAEAQTEERLVRARIVEARERLGSLTLPAAMLSLATALCAEIGVDGMRGDLALVKAARALAAWEATAVVDEQHLRTAARFALAHRKRRKPFDAVENVERETERFFSEKNSKTPAEAPSEYDTRQAGAPEGSGAKENESQDDEASSSPDSSSPEERPAPVPPGGGTRSLGLKLATAERAGRRRSLEGGQGMLRSKPDASAGSALDLPASLRAAALRGAGEGAGPVALQAEDLRHVWRGGHGATRVLFAVDASGSMAAGKRLSLAKAAVFGLLSGSYQQRDEVALLAFRGEGAELLLPFTRDVAQAERCLREVPTGGRTPLSDALRQAVVLAGVEGSLLLVLFTDGRANVAAAGGDPWTEALATAELLRPRLAAALVVDCENGPVRLGRAQLLADKLGARCLGLAELDAEGLVLRLKGVSEQS